MTVVCHIYSVCTVGIVNERKTNFMKISLHEKTSIANIKYRKRKNKSGRVILRRKNIKIS